MPDATLRLVLDFETDDDIVATDDKGRTARFFKREIVKLDRKSDNQITLTVDEAVARSRNMIDE